MVPWLQALVALSEDRGSIPRAHTVDYNLEPQSSGLH